MLRLLALCLLFSTPAFSQNYVINGSFERGPNGQTGLAPVCAFSGNPNIFNYYVQGWQTYKSMTPDLLVVNDTEPCSWLPRPRTGSRMVGLIMYHPSTDSGKSTDYHELIQGTLGKPLETGKTYRVRFRTRTSDSIGILHLSRLYGNTLSYLPMHCGNFGFYFSKGKINVHEKFFQSQLDFPLQPQINHEAIVETTADNWTQITMFFTADQPYQYFLFGNFFFDAVTPVNLSAEERMRIDAENAAASSLNLRTIRIAYYCFDDFVVEEYQPNAYTETLREQQQLSFDAELLFDVDQAVLKSGAKTALEQLAGALSQLQGLQVEIGGHTDNTGSDTHNLELSERRARAVVDFLLEHGLPASQLRSKGYGESRPVADNTSEAGRQKNRRVECRVVPGE